MEYLKPTGLEWMTKRYEDNRILSSGREDLHRSGVALVLGPLAEKALLGYNPVSDLIITARFRHTSDQENHDRMCDGMPGLRSNNEGKR